MVDTAEREVRLPALTTTMEEAELVEWRVEVGDDVREGQALCEIVTDKVDMSLESPFDGTVAALLVEAGSVVTVGAAVARIATDSDDVLGDLELGGGAAAEGGVADDGTVAEGGGVAPAVDAGGAGEGADPGDGPARVPAPPPVRLRARQAGVDLADVPRTGRRGQVTSDDLRRYLEQREAARGPAGATADAGAAPTAPTGSDTAAPGAGSTGAAPAVPPAADRRAADDRGPLDRRRAALRAATAKVVTRSAGIPQFTLHRAIDLTRAAGRREGRTWTTEIVRALAVALRAHPELNARWDDDAGRAEPIDRVRIGLAVAVPVGLVVVGLDDPDQITPTHANEHVLQVVGRARDGALDTADVEGITFTVSNLGGFGVDAFDALLMPPQAGILSVGRVVERPVVVDGRVRPRLQVDVGLTVDHRVADGADGARLLATFAEALEG